MSSNQFKVAVISDEEFNAIAKLVYDHFGIHLTDKKKTLVTGRLNSLLKQKNFKTFKELYDHILDDETGRALSDLINKISTNHTYFFRESDHFDLLKSTILSEVSALTPQTNDIRLWCAGCATGEEPYTLAMTANDFTQNHPGKTVSILATDISMNALEKAIEGKYTADKLRNISPLYIQKYFTKELQTYYVKAELKKNILFKRLNLMRENFPFKNRFHIIFCRNVMIYFDRQTRQRLVAQFYKHLQPGGYLFIGHSESLLKEQSYLKYLKPAVYYKPLS